MRRSLAEVVVGELEVADLGCHDRLGGGGQRGVSYGECLVVGEVPGLLLLAERIAEDVHREHEVGLLDDLLAVEVEVREVQEQGILLRPRVFEIPELVAGEALRLRWTPSASSHGITIAVRCVAPGRGLLEIGPERCSVAGMTGDRIGCSAHVPLCQQVGVDVVVGDRAVLVRARDAVDAEAPCES